MSGRKKQPKGGVAAPAAVIIPDPPPDDVPEPTDVRYPDPAEVPDWSAETLGRLRTLTRIERAFVEWFASGVNAAEAYRRATGAEYTDRDTDTTRKNGYAIHARPRVRQAIDAALKDRNFGARSDREWKLQKYRAILALCEASKESADLATAARVLKQMAELQGEIVKRNEVEHRGQGQSVSVCVRVDSILAEAARLIATTAGGPDRAAVGGRPAVAGARGDEPLDAQHRPAGVGVPK